MIFVLRKELPCSCKAIVSIWKQMEPCCAVNAMELESRWQDLEQRRRPLLSTGFRDAAVSPTRFDLLFAWSRSHTSEFLDELALQQSKVVSKGFLLLILAQIQRTSKRCVHPERWKVFKTRSLNMSNLDALRCGSNGAAWAGVSGTTVLLPLTES